MTIHHAIDWASAGRVFLVFLTLLLVARGIFGPFGNRDSQAKGR